MIYNLEDLLLAKEELEMSMDLLINSAVTEESYCYTLGDLAAINCLLDEVGRTRVYVIFE